MARRSVRCSCGADFPIPEVPPLLLHCPKCGEPVRFTRSEGGAVKVREDIRGPIRPLTPSKPYYPLILLGSGGLLLAAGLVAIIIMFSGGETRRDPLFSAEVRQKGKAREDEPVISIRGIPSIPESSKDVPWKPPTVDPVPVYDPAEELARGEVLSARINLSGIVSTMYLLTRRMDEHRALQTVLEKDEKEIRKLLEILSDRADALSWKGRYQAGDAFTGFGIHLLDPEQPMRFADAIRDWISTVQPGAALLAVVHRDGRQRTIPMWFPEIPADIVARELRSGGLPAATILPFPRELLDEVKRRTAALLPYHRKTLPTDDSARLDRLAAAGRGTREDLEFLRNRILPYCARSEAEVAGFVTKVAALEAAVTAALSQDTVVFRDGRRLAGQVEEETDESVRIKGHFGAMKALKADVLRIERGDAAGAEFRKKYGAARGKEADLTALLSWCKEKNLSQPRELAAYAILAGDPGNDAAWTALGVVDRGPAPAGPEFDVVWLKDGTKREGILAEETESAIQFDVIVRGAKSETIGTGKAAIPRLEIARIERMSDAARKRAKERAVSFGERSRKTQEALAAILLTPETFHGVPGLRATGTLFELHSTCAPSQVRETAYMLEEMFNAYRRHFAVRRNAAKRIDVYFLANATEYAAFQQATRGTVAPNPAYFETQQNHIAAYYGVQKEEEARLRAAILASEREIEQQKKSISGEEEWITKEFRALRQVILDRAAISKKTAGDDARAQATHERLKQENLGMARSQERAALEQVARERARVNQAIAEHERIIRHNQAVLAAQSKAMYEILFHESFHAFAANFLWEDADNAGLPRWLHEGMATYFERSAVEVGELVHGGAHPGFLALLRTHQRENRLLALATLVNAGADLFHIQHNGDIPRQEAAYAHAWGLAHYLMTRGVTRDQIETYVADVAAGRSRIAAFEKLSGKRLPEVEAEWRIHLGSLK